MNEQPIDKQPLATKMPAITDETFNGSVRQCSAFESSIYATNAPNQSSLCKTHRPAMSSAMIACTKDAAQRNVINCLVCDQGL